MSIAEIIKEQGCYFTVMSERSNEGLHCYDFFEIIYVLSGDAVLETTTDSRKITEYEYVVITSGFEHNLIVPKGSLLLKIFISCEAMEKFLCVFGDDVKKYIMTAEEPLSVVGDFIVKLKINEAYTRILKYGDDDKLLCKLMANEILTGIIRKMHRKSKADETPDEIVNAINELYKPENLKIGVPALAKITNYSRSNLCSVMRKYYGKTPLQMVNDLRMNYANNLILYSNMALDEISEMVGFNSVSHFYKMFYQYFSVTPASIRKKAVEAHAELGEKK